MNRNSGEGLRFPTGAEFRRGAFRVFSALLLSLTLASSVQAISKSSTALPPTPARDTVTLPSCNPMPLGGESFYVGGRRLSKPSHVEQEMYKSCLENPDQAAIR